MRNLWGFLVLFVLVGILTGCNLPRQDSAPDLAATLSAITPNLSTPLPATVMAATDNPDSIPVLPGKIAYTCQIFGIRYRDQICIINPDGSGFKRLTTEDYVAHFYPSVSPDGKSIVYSAKPDKYYEIFEIDLDGNIKRLTDSLGTLVAPEISPDGSLIVFSLGDGTLNSILTMKRDGSDLRKIHEPGWDPTWSPDGSQILFASTAEDQSNQLFVINLDGSGLRQLTNLSNLRGRSDWSPDGNWIVTYAGESWHREVYLLPASGGEAVQISPAGGNGQGPSFSPDSQWVAFTAYYGNIGVDNGCEIYIMKLDGSNLTRLTDNAYCDWQPRWGP